MGVKFAQETRRDGAQAGWEDSKGRKRAKRGGRAESRRRERTCCMGTETGAEVMKGAQGTEEERKGPGNGARDQEMVQGTRKWCNKPKSCTECTYGPSIV